MHLFFPHKQTFNFPFISVNLRKNIEILKGFSLLNQHIIIFNGFMIESTLCLDMSESQIWFQFRQIWEYHPVVVLLDVDGRLHFLHCFAVVPLVAVDVGQLFKNLLWINVQMFFLHGVHFSKFGAHFFSALEQFKRSLFITLLVKCLAGQNQPF